MTASWCARGRAVERRVTTVPRHLVEGERVGFHAGVEPRDAATLIIIDRAMAEPRVLLGRRHASHAFMPGKFVFPGGRVDTADQTMPAANPLDPNLERRLLAATRFKSGQDAVALVLAAIRETFEETGIVIGAKGVVQADKVSGPWRKFLQTGFCPDPSPLQFVARAITPPGFPRRFDARFFCVDNTAIVHRTADVVHADAELIELKWLPISDAQRLDLPVITDLVLDEISSRMREGFRPDLPVPFYATRDGDFTRELID